MVTFHSYVSLPDSRCESQKPLNFAGRTPESPTLPNARENDTSGETTSNKSKDFPPQFLGGVFITEGMCLIVWW